MISNLHTQLLVADQPLAALQALGRAVVRRQRVQGLHFWRGEEGVMAVHRQWALPFSVDTQDPQLPVVTGHVGGARGVHMQSLCAVVYKVIVVFCREKYKNRESNWVNSLFAERDTVCTLYTLVYWKIYV